MSISIICSEVITYIYICIFMPENLEVSINRIFTASTQLHFNNIYLYVFLVATNNHDND